MKSLRRVFRRGGDGVALGEHQPRVHRHVTFKEWLRRLGWRGLWVVAYRSMRIWLADPTFTESTAVALSRRDGCLVAEPGVVSTISGDTTPSAGRPCAHSSS